MKTPALYDPRLPHILDVHAANGIVPGWYAVHFPTLENDFKNFFLSSGIGEAKSILDIGGRSMPYAALFPHAEIFQHEPRIHYHAAAREFFKNITPIDLTDGFGLKNVDLVLINLEIGGLSNHRVPANLNESFRKDLQVFGYQYDRPAGAALCDFLDDGTPHDSTACAIWIKNLQNHMHMGVEKTAVGLLTVHDLTRMY